jgi:hypothetical protein
MNYQNDSKYCSEAMDLFKKCADTCRTFATKSESLFCKTTFFAMACCMEGCMKSMKMCMEMCSKGGDEKGMNSTLSSMMQQ